MNGSNASLDDSTLTAPEACSTDSAVPLKVPPSGLENTSLVDSGESGDVIESSGDCRIERCVSKEMCPESKNESKDGDCIEGTEGGRVEGGRVDGGEGDCVETSEDDEAENEGGIEGGCVEGGCVEGMDGGEFHGLAGGVGGGVRGEKMTRRRWTFSACDQLTLHDSMLLSSTQIKIISFVN